MYTFEYPKYKIIKLDSGTYTNLWNMFKSGEAAKKKKPTTKKVQIVVMYIALRLYQVF